MDFSLTFSGVDCSFCGILAICCLAFLCIALFVVFFILFSGSPCWGKRELIVVFLFMSLTCALSITVCFRPAPVSSDKIFCLIICLIIH